MTPKYLFLTMAAAGAITSASAQGFLDRVANNAVSATERAVNRKVDKKIDDAVNSEPQHRKAKTQSGSESSSAGESGESGGTVRKGVKSSKSNDFVPGTQVLYSEDFRQDVTGEFPLKWYTKSSGETAEIEGAEGKWLRMMPDGRYASPIVSLKDNYTIEFDIVADIPTRGYLPAEFGFRLIDNGEGKKAVTNEFRERTIAGFKLYPYTSKSQLTFETEEGGKEYFRTPVTGVSNFLERRGEVIHVAMHVQKSRLRLWFDKEKVIDAPDVIPAGTTFNQLLFTMSGTNYSKDEIAYYVTNIRLAAASADTRSKLITEGRLSTTGITFAVNSDAITPTSYPTLKEIADALKTAADMKVRITGHTDSDGEDARNLELSKKRAAAVKQSLVKDFGIAADRLITEGKGESAPVADNASAEGKAANRRVEFVRI